MKRTAWLLVLAGLGLAAAMPSGRKPESGTTMDPRVRVLHEQVARGKTPAIQYRHFTSDSVLVAYDDGLADLSRGRAVSSATTFHGLSITKTATAVAVLQLVDRGLIELDGPAADYLPGFPHGRGITVRHLLAHSAGLGNPIPLSWIHLAEEHAGFEPRSFFGPVLAAARPKSPPNRRFRYSNLGYVLLGEIVENVSSLKYEEYVTRHVLAPIGLEPAELGFAQDPGTHARGYHPRRSASRMLLGLLLDTSKYLEAGQGGWQAFRPYHVNGPAYGGLIGTAAGFTRYAQALLDPASGLLSAESRTALFSEHMLGDGTPSGMSLSWFRGSHAGHEYVAHAGGGGGYYAELRLYPALGRGSVVLFNRTGMSDARFLDQVDRHILPAAGRQGTRSSATAAANL